MYFRTLKSATQQAMHRGLLPASKKVFIEKIHN